MTAFYPSYLRELFTNRAHELSVLANVAEDLRGGHPRHVALFGLRRVGKTLLAQEQVVRLLARGDVAPVYLDMEGICSAPEPFAQRYVGLTCYWILSEGEGPVDHYLTADRLLETEAAEVPLIARTAGALIRELGHRKPDYSALLRLAFDFPEQLAEAMDRSIM